MSTTKFYHCSPKRFKKGDILISPSDDSKHNYPGQGHAGVFVNTSPIPHFTIWVNITNKWHVYEVSPTGTLSYGMWDDIICETAVVISRVGNAKGILDNYKKKRVPLKDKNGYIEDTHKLNKEAYVHRKDWHKMKKKW